MRRRDVLAACLAAPAIPGCMPSGPRWELNYRITLRVLADRREYAGSSIFRSIYRAIPEGSPSDYAHGARTTGEAIAVPLGERGLLIGILRKIDGIETEQGFRPDRPYTLFPLLPRAQQ